MSTDFRYIEALKKASKPLSENFTQGLKYSGEHPLDEDIIELLEDLKIVENSDEYQIFKVEEKIVNIWNKLLKKSIICLRYFDTREPFINSEDKKKPLAYGVNELSSYFSQYTEFETTLYGSVDHYRDHVIHVFRVWLIGINKLLEGNNDYLNNIEIKSDSNFKINNFEKISMWSIIALTHDLGYPLEKSSQIIEKTKNMMKAFVSNPSILMDFSFSGVQNSMNDFILRFISSKMREVKVINNVNDENNKQYVVRLQPKYYFKFQKSLEHNEHGILSILIIYKLLLYFLESDYSLNEDYRFIYEEARQFYIRRDILRAIASHTCKDIYQNNATSFSLLLIVCDEAQEWGRKNISQLYRNGDVEYSLKSLTIKKTPENTYEIEIEDEYTKINELYIIQLLKRFYNQCVLYRNLFRDGQDTSSRDFIFTRKMHLNIGINTNIKDFPLTLEIKKNEQTKIIIDCSNENNENDENIIKNFFKDNTEKIDPKYKLSYNKDQKQMIITIL